MTEVTLPTPPDGYEYKHILVPVKMKRETLKPKRETLKDKDPKELTRRQLIELKYREKNKEILLAKKRIKYHEDKKKKSNLSDDQKQESQVKQQ